LPQSPRRLGAGKLLQLQVQVCKLSSGMPSCVEYLTVPYPKERSRLISARTSGIWTPTHLVWICSQLVCLKFKALNRRLGSSNSGLGKHAICESGPSTMRSHLWVNRSTRLKLFLCRNCWPIRISKREPYGLPISELQWRPCCRVSGFGTNSERHCVPQPSFRTIRSEIGLKAWVRRRPMFLHERQCQLRINWPKTAQTLCVRA